MVRAGGASSAKISASANAAEEVAARRGVDEWRVDGSAGHGVRDQAPVRLHESRGLLWRRREQVQTHGSRTAAHDFGQRARQVERDRVVDAVSYTHLTLPTNREV